MLYILQHYFDRVDDVITKPLTQGHINSTYEVYLGQNKYILQRLNTSIFKNPDVIVSNILAVAQHLKAKNYQKGIIDVIPNLNGNFLTFVNGETWRMTNFIPQSVCHEKVLSKEQAFQAAKTISEFHRLMLDLPIDKIRPSIEGFLDFGKRVKDFQFALENGNSERILNAKDQIDYINNHLDLINQYLTIDFPTRLVHADAKISNFLFHENNELEVTALIDWDTFIPGNIFCDFGDMIRTYSNLKAEDDPNANDNFSFEYYQAVKEGFLSELKDVISEEELEVIDLSAFVVVLIQAIRFLTDYLSNDTYYHTSRKNQNLDRTINQINLLKAIEEAKCIA